MLLDMGSGEYSFYIVFMFRGQRLIGSFNTTGDHWTSGGNTDLSTDQVYYKIEDKMEQVGVVM